ncbi:MAG: hypothetical protein V1887_00990 [Candidatus Aenigmatarchaeota archaeon]
MMVEVLSEKSGDLMLVTIIALLIFAAVLVILASTDIIKFPCGNFWDCLNQNIESLGREIGLFGKQTADQFCSKPLEDDLAICAITDSQLKTYCDLSQEEKLGTCQKAESGMTAFCEKLSYTEREKYCQDRNGFRSGCQKIIDEKNQWDTTKHMSRIMLIADVAFCK